MTIEKENKAMKKLEAEADIIFEIGCALRNTEYKEMRGNKNSMIVRDNSDGVEYKIMVEKYDENEDIIKRSKAFIAERKFI